MADKQQLKILKSGAEAWNTWREENSEITIDLHGANLQGANLQDANLQDADLRDADLRAADLRAADLRSARIWGATMWGANIRKADFRHIVDVHKGFLLQAEHSGAIVSADVWGIGRSVEFSPEHRDAGVAILGYFATFLENKYPDEAVTIQIEQNGPKVTMTVRAEEGDKEIIEKALEEYGLLMSGQKQPEQVFSNPGHILDLRNQLQGAHAGIRKKIEVLLLSKAEHFRLGQQRGTLPEAPADEALVIANREEDLQSSWAEGRLEGYRETMAALQESALKTVRNEGRLEGYREAMAAQQNEAMLAIRTEGHLEGLREGIRTMTSKTLVEVNNAPTANSTSQATASASATVNITGPVYALQGELRHLAEQLPADSPAREDVEAVEKSLDTIAKETDADEVKKSSALSRLRGFVEDLGDDKSRVGKAAKGLGNFARISKTIAAEAAKLVTAIDASGLFRG